MKREEKKSNMQTADAYKTTTTFVKEKCITNPLHDIKRTETKKKKFLRSVQFMEEILTQNDII